MSLDQIVREEAQKLEIVLMDDAIPMFHYAFSKTGTIDMHLLVALQRESEGLSPEKANEARVRFIVNDVLYSSRNLAVDSKFREIIWGPNDKVIEDKAFVDAYIILLVIAGDASYEDYLRHDFLPFKVLREPHHIPEDQLRPDQIQYPGYTGVIYSYAWSVFPGQKNRDNRSDLIQKVYRLFENSPLRVLNMENTYLQLLSFTNQGK